MNKLEIVVGEMEENLSLMHFASFIVVFTVGAHQRGALSFFSAGVALLSQIGGQRKE